jgi:hypothetical protein
VAAQAKGRWERVQFFDNRGDTVLVADGGRPALHLCHIESGLGAGLHFQAQGGGIFEEMEVLGCTGPGVEIDAGGNPSLKAVKAFLGKGPGIIAKAGAGGALENCESAENAGGDWIIDPAARIVRT